MVSTTEKTVSNATLARMARLRLLMPMFAYYQSVEDHTLKDLDWSMLALKLISGEESILIKLGKLLNHIFMPSVMLSKDKCLPIRPKKKVLLPSSSY